VLTSVRTPTLGGREGQMYTHTQRQRSGKWGSWEVGMEGKALRTEAVKDGGERPGLLRG
jgi:hypothetical protein